MLRTTFVLFGVLVVFSSGYQINDAEFSEALIEELLDAGHEIDGRYKRDIPAEDDKCGKPGKFGGFLSKCCEGMSVNETVLDEIKAAKRECLGDKKPHGPPTDMLTCEGLLKAKEAIACGVECFIKKQQFSDDKGNLNAEKLLEFFRDRLLVTDWAKSAVEIAIPKCIEMASNAPAQPDSTCSQKPLHFKHCLFRELSKSCPKDLQKETPKCQKFREFYNGNGILNGQPPPALD